MSCSPPLLLFLYGGGRGNYSWNAHSSVKYFLSLLLPLLLSLSLFLARHVMQFSVEIVQNIRKRTNGEETEEK